MIQPRNAVLVIDMQVDFFERQPVLAAQRSPLVAKINELTGYARHGGHSVIWVRQEFQPDLSDSFLDMRRQGIRITIAGTEGCRILPELEQAAGDLVVVKKRYSAFYGTDLDAILQRLNPAALIVAGINTHACVRMTVIDAFQRDRDVILAKECTSSYDAAHHAVTLRYLGGQIARLLSNRELADLVCGSAV